MPAAASTSEMISRSLPRGEARVVADDQALAGVLVLVNVVRHGVAHAAHVVEGEVVGDDAAPAVGAEFDWSGHVR